MATVFLICAVVGGALVVAQLMLSVVAFGMGHGLHLHRPHGGSMVAPRAAGVRGGHHFRGGARSHASHTPRASGRGAAHRPTSTQAGKSSAKRTGTLHALHGHWAIAWVQGMFNFQGIVAGATVFGLAGRAAMAAKLPPHSALLIGVVAALFMMALIEALFEFMARMDSDCTVDIQQAVGQCGTVYLGIPPRNQGQGKITINLQQRLMEFPAVTYEDSPLTAAQKVIVLSVLDPSVMVVALAENTSGAGTVTTE